MKAGGWYIRVSTQRQIRPFTPKDLEALRCVNIRTRRPVRAAQGEAPEHRHRGLSLTHRGSGTMRRRRVESLTRVIQEPTDRLLCRHVDVSHMNYHNNVQGLISVLLSNRIFKIRSEQSDVQGHVCVSPINTMDILSTINTHVRLFSTVSVIKFREKNMTHDALRGPLLGYGKCSVVSC